MTSHFTREVQIERQLFLSQLPEAVGNREYEVSGNLVTVKDGSRRVRIELVSKGTEKKGALKLPMKEVHFDFQGFSQAEIDEFMNHYDLATRRPGGA
jgi:hypothetical protein